MTKPGLCVGRGVEVVVGEDGGPDEWCLDGMRGRLTRLSSGGQGLRGDVHFPEVPGRYPESRWTLPAGCLRAVEAE